MEYFTCSLFDKAGISTEIKNSVQNSKTSLWWATRISYYHKDLSSQEYFETVKIYSLILPQIISWKINVYIITVVHVHWMHFNFNRMQVIIQFLLSKWGEIIHSFKVTEALTNTNFSLADPWFLDVINWKDDKVWAISKRRPYYILKKIWL